MSGGQLFIGELAEQAGVNPKTIRYYETVGVLSPPHRGENRYRRYSKEAVKLLQFIRKAQGLGLALSEIKEIVELHRRGCAPCVHVQSLIRRKIADLDRQLADLVDLRRRLKRLLAGWKKPTTGPRIETTVCPEIEGIGRSMRPPGGMR